MGQDGDVIALISVRYSLYWSIVYLMGWGGFTLLYLYFFVLFLQISEQLKQRITFWESKWNRNGIDFIFIDLVSMYGEITYNDSKSITIKAIPFRFHLSILKKCDSLFQNCSEICSTVLYRRTVLVLENSTAVYPYFVLPLGPHFDQ